MRHEARFSRSPAVPVLGTIALLLFCVHFLLFLDRQVPWLQHEQVVWTDDPDAIHFFEEETALYEPAQGQQGDHRGIVVVEQPFPSLAHDTYLSDELRLRAAQSAEYDAALRQRLGLQDESPVIILR
ncbi:MAG: hypothetical protein ACE5G0_05365 [Rhodothermales bacterium]